MDYLGIKSFTYYRWIADGVLVPRGAAGEDKFFLRDIKRLTEERKYRKRRKPARRGNETPA